MQVVRRWHREKLHPSESLFDPAVNIRVATDILEEYLASANGSLTKALVKYSGNARGYSKKIIKESIALWLGHESILKTQAYLNAHIALKTAALAKLQLHNMKRSEVFESEDRIRAFMDRL